MEKANVPELNAFTTLVIAPGTPHKLWYPGAEPLVLLTTGFAGGARCAPAYSDADTVMIEG